MADQAPAATGPDTKLEELADIATRQLSEEATSSHLAKAVANTTEALTRLTDHTAQMFALLKGGKKAADDDDDDEDDDDSDEEDDDSEDEDGDDDDQPGFRSMDKGGSSYQTTLFGGDDADDDEGVPMNKGAQMDDNETGLPEDFLADMAKASMTLLDQQEATDARLDAMAEQLDQLAKASLHLAKMIEHLGGVQAEGLGELVKAARGTAPAPVAEATAAAQPAAPAPAPAPVGLTDRSAVAPKVTPTPPPSVTATPRVASMYLAGVPDERAEKKLLMKAVNAQVITPIADNLYRTTGKFAPDEATHNQIAADVVAFATGA